MARKTKELESLWWDWLSTAERLLRSLHEQTAALTLRDIGRVERIQPELENFRALMDDIDERASACAREMASERGCEPNLKGLVGSMEKQEGQQLHALANRVIVVGRNVQQVVAKNRTLIENELDYVGGTMALVARESVERSTQYGHARTGSATVIMNQVA